VLKRRSSALPWTGDAAFLIFINASPPPVTQSKNEGGALLSRFSFLKKRNSKKAVPFLLASNLQRLKFFSLSSSPEKLEFAPVWGAFLSLFAFSFPLA